jgi:hypothetical protein
MISRVGFLSSGGKPMAVQTITWAWDWVFGGDNGYTASNEYHFAPINSLAQTSLSVASPGLGVIGFTKFWNRQPNGVDQPHDLAPVNADGGLICYPPLVYDPNLTGATWVLICGGGLDQMAGSLLFFHF